MNKWITSIIEAPSVDAVSKARKDIVEIATSVGYQPTYIFRYIDENETLDALHSRIDGITAALYRGDILIYQYPCYNSDRFEKEFIHRMKLRGIHVAILIHDTELLRGNSGEIERAIFSEADVLITHGDKMTTALQKLGISTPMISKELFDYILNEEINDTSEEVEKKLIIAGNLRKSIFLENWSSQIPLQAFGRIGQLTLDASIDYRGEFHQSDLLRIIPREGIGLAWDSKIIGGGDYQQYTRYNAPHKLSLYLALGIPIIVWNQSAAADIVNKYALGFTISSLEEIDNVIENTSDEQFLRMKKNVAQFSRILSEGFYTRQALLAVEKFIFFNEIEMKSDE
ncbi:sugar transferase [Enterococcus sp. LJL99]